MSDIRRILTETRVIAVLWANPRESAPAFYVPAYLAQRGYRVYPIHPAPMHADRVLWGQPMLPTLADVPEPIDLIDVFRFPQALPRHIPEILGLEPLPKVVWFQQGIVNNSVAGVLRVAGIEVIQDRCTLADHRMLGL